MSDFELPPLRDPSILHGRVFPLLRALIEAGYFSLDVEGAPHIPREGGAVYVGNHAGWFTLDTFMFALALAEHVGIDGMPYGAVQDQLFRVPGLGRFFEGVGGFPASLLRNPGALPPEMQRFLIYPEGTEGNCKPFWRAYQMARWRTSFVHVAAVRDALVVPMAIVGGEECLPVATTIRCLKPLLGSILPLPLFTWPLPCRWKVIFHEPVRVGGDFAGCDQRGAAKRRRLADSIRSIVQRTLERETTRRRLAWVGRLFGPPGTR